MRLRFALVTAASLLFVAAPALADNPPTKGPPPAVLAQIEETLRDNGYVNWRSIGATADKSAWVVDDALASDGNVYDLTILARNYKIAARKPQPPQRIH